MNSQRFVEEVHNLNIDLTEEQLVQLEKYYKLLVSYNEKVNLTAIIAKKEVYLKHFYDSLTLTKIINLNRNLIICDIGTGAGFPGIVLKICFPQIKVTLVDSLEKRIKFLDLVIEELGLKDIETINSRIEEFSAIEKYDVVVSRAVAKTNILLELGSQLVKVGGHFILMKGNVDEELKKATNAINMLSYSLEKMVSFLLPIEQSERNLLDLIKIKSTNKCYPREFSKIKKMPL